MGFSCFSNIRLLTSKKGYEKLKDIIDKNLTDNNIDISFNILKYCEY